MRILHINNTLASGGAERLIEGLSVQMSKQGHYVEVLISSDYNLTFVDQLKEHNIKYTTLLRGFRNIYNPLIIFKLLGYLKGFDVIHVHLFPVQYWFAIASVFSIKKGLYITTEHNTENRRRSSPIFKFIDKWVYKQYDRIISISEQTQSKLQVWLNDRSRKFYIVKNGIDLNMFETALAYQKRQIIPGIAKDAILIVMVARLDKQKDHLTVFKALGNLIREGDFHLALVGVGPLEALYREFCLQNQLADRVHFLGRRKDVPAIIKAADICILISNWEGFGLAAIEYMAARKPTIVSDVPGLREVVGEGAIKIAPYDYLALAKKLQELAYDKTAWQEWATKGYAQAIKYDLKEMTKHYLAVYHSVETKQK